MPHPFRYAPLLLAAALLPLGCAEEPAAVDVYRVRGVVKALPEAGNPVSSFMVHHEAIPTFIGHNGSSDPMPEMTMGFPTAAGVSLDGLEIGDKVELRFEVTRGQGYQATDILPLAGDLELNLNQGTPGHDHTGHDHLELNLNRGMPGHDHTGHDHSEHAPAGHDTH